MTRRRKILLSGGLALAVFAGLFVIVGRYLTRDFRERQAALQPLLATNAPLPAIEAAIGHIPIYRRGTSEWLQFHGSFATTNASAWSHMIAQKIERSPSTGFTTTMSMMTFIFLDEHDRLVDFELGTQ
jgi:branched-subunit amino acid ABC-type transport system permease component